MYLPRIKRSIELFRNAWNHHSLRTAHHSSPLQLYTSGALRLQQANLPALDFFDSVDAAYGVNEDELVPVAEGGVHVPETRLNITPESLAVLQLHMNPFTKFWYRTIRGYCNIFRNPYTACMNLFDDWAKIVITT